MSTIVVTGSNSGIGKEVVGRLLKLKHEVIMVAKQSPKTESAVQELKQKHPSAKIHLETCDLSDLNQVQDLATRLNGYPVINVLINNAGLEMMKRRSTAQGFELSLAVNYLAHFLLSHLLLLKLLSQPGSKIINTSSMVERWGKIDLQNFQMEKNYDPEKAYYRSKLALLFFTYEFNRHLHSTQLTVNAFEPGLTKTDFFRDFKGAMGLGSRIMRLFLRNPRKVAETPVFLATDDSVLNITGQTFYNGKIVKTSPQSDDPQIASEFWLYTTKLLSEYLPD